jgi:CubicO group peptidase (beta-lactamase class C family)
MVSTRLAGPVAALALTAAAAVAAGCAKTGTEASLSSRIDALVAPLVAANQFSGAIVLSRAGRPVYQRGFGVANHSAGLAFTPETPADGGSLAKTFTAAGVWLLVQEGRVDLDAPVTRYLPDYPHAQTTVRHLLAHSNGLPPYYEFFDPYFAKDEVRTTSALLQVVAKQAPAPAFRPGTRFEYSNVGFDAAALVIERVTGQSYEAFLKERFFSRLGMTATFARPARLADWTGVRTLGYRWREGAWHVFDVYDMEAFLGASNLYFSAADLGRWASANAAGTAIPAAVASAGGAATVIDGKPSGINGLSWYCSDTGAHCHYTGSVNAFHSLVYWDRSRNESVALVINSTMPPWAIVTLQRNLVAALAGRPVQPDTPGPFMALTRETHARAAGAYTARGFGVVTVEAGPAHLTLRVDCGLTFDAFPVASDVFYVPGMDYWIGFGGEQPTTLHLRSMFVDTTLDRRPPPATSCN